MLDPLTLLQCRYYLDLVEKRQPTLMDLDMNLLYNFSKYFGLAVRFKELPKKLHGKYATLPDFIRELRLFFIQIVAYLVRCRTFPGGDKKHGMIRKCLVELTEISTFFKLPQLDHFYLYRERIIYTMRQLENTTFLHNPKFLLFPYSHNTWLTRVFEKLEQGDYTTVQELYHDMESIALRFRYCNPSYTEDDYSVPASTALWIQFNNAEGEVEKWLEEIKYCCKHSEDRTLKDSPNMTTQYYRDTDGLCSKKPNYRLAQKGDYPVFLPWERAMYAQWRSDNFVAQVSKDETEEEKEMYRAWEQSLIAHFRAYLEQNPLKEAYYHWNYVKRREVAKMSPIAKGIYFAQHNLYRILKEEWGQDEDEMEEEVEEKEKFATLDDGFEMSLYAAYILVPGVTGTLGLKRMIYRNQDHYVDYASAHGLPAIRTKMEDLEYNSTKYPGLS